MSKLGFVLLLVAVSWLIVFLIVVGASQTLGAGFQ